MQRPHSPASQWASRVAALALVGGAAALAVFALTFGNEASLIRGFLVAGSPEPPDGTSFATTGSVAFAVLVAGLMLAVWLLIAPLRSLYACAGAWSLLAIGSTFWILGEPAASLRAYGLSATPLPLGPVGIFLGAMAGLCLAVSLVGWIVTPARRTWFEAAPPIGHLALPPPTHQA
jgi:hypothetical protein